MGTTYCLTIGEAIRHSEVTFDIDIETGVDYTHLMEKFMREVGVEGGGTL